MSRFVWFHDDYEITYDYDQEGPSVDIVSVTDSNGGDPDLDSRELRAIEEEIISDHAVYGIENGR